jgi:multidrug efflux pump subunit AcrA (membrane-fusion protein)
MIRRIWLPALAVIGLGLAAGAVFLDNRAAAPVAAAVPPATSGFPSFVAGTGIVEAAGENIQIGSPASGIVADIPAKWGQHVAAGDELYAIDDGDLRAQLLPAAARVAECAAKLDQSKDLLAIAENVADKRAVSVEEIKTRRHAVARDAAALATARAEVRRIEMERERRIVRAPVSGRVLSVAIHPGEFVQSGGAAPVVLGDDRRLWVLADIDEFDAGRVRPGSAAQASPRGDPSIRIPLTFERIDPIMVPKASLAGGGTERVDTRVLQVVYSFDPAALPRAAIGQQLDVFIETRP